MKKLVLSIISYSLLIASADVAQAWQPKTALGQSLKNALGKTKLGTAVTNFATKTQVGQALVSVGKDVGGLYIQQKMGCSDFGMIASNLLALKNNLQATGMLANAQGQAILAQINTVEQSMNTARNNLVTFGNMAANVTLQNIDATINQAEITIQSIENFKQQYNALATSVAPFGMQMPSLDLIWLNSKTYMLSLAKTVLNKKKQVEASTTQTIQQAQVATQQAASNQAHLTPPQNTAAMAQNPNLALSTLSSQLTGAILMGIDVNHPYSIQNLKTAITNIQTTYNAAQASLTDENLRQAMVGLSQYSMDAADAALANKVNQWGTQQVNTMNSMNTGYSVNGTIQGLNNQVMQTNYQMQQQQNMYQNGMQMQQPVMYQNGMQVQQPMYNNQQMMRQY